MNVAAQGAGGVAAAAFTLPALGFALGPAVQPRAVQVAGDRPAGRLQRDDLRDEGDHDRPGDRRGRQVDRLRAQARPEIDTEPADQYNHWIALSSRCMHLGCPVRFVSAAERFICPCHGGVYDFRGMVAGGPPVRPLDRFYTRLNTPRPRRDRPALLGQLRAASASRRVTPASRSTGSGSILYPGAVLDRSSVPDEPIPSDAQASRTPASQDPPADVPSAPATRRTNDDAARGRRRGRHHASSTGSTSARRCRAASAGCCSARSRKGINWFYTLGSATMFAFLNQAVTGVFLAMYYRPDVHGRRVRVDPLHHRRRVPRPVRARHAQVGRVGDDHPDLPAHGRACSSSAPTSTRAS